MSSSKAVLEAVALLKSVRALNQPFPPECVTALTPTYAILPPPWIAIPGHTEKQVSAYSTAWKTAVEQSGCAAGDAVCSAYVTLFPQPRSWGNATLYGSSSSSSSANHHVALWSTDGQPSFGLAELVRAIGSQSEPFDYIFFWGHTDRKKSSKAGAAKRKRGNNARHDDGAACSDGDVKGSELSKACLSQWWPCKFVEEGVEYTTAEQYMMAWKARVFNDAKICDRILAASDPHTIKKLGREVSGFNPAEWERVKFSIVAQGNFLKFSQDATLREFLLSTGESVLVEASPFDTIWGIGVSESNAAKKNVCLTDPSTWRGQNLLGFALMDARSEIRRVYGNTERVLTRGA